MPTEREDAIHDRGYADGFYAGWNAAMKYHAETWTDAFPDMVRRVERQRAEALAVLASMEKRRADAVAVLKGCLE